MHARLMAQNRIIKEFLFQEQDALAFIPAKIWVLMARLAVL